MSPLVVTTKSFCAYLPPMIVSSSKTSKMGSPALLLTLIRTPVRLSTILNRLPFVPSALNIVSPEVAEYTCSVAFGETVLTPISFATYKVSPSKVKLALPAAILLAFL